MQDAPFETNNLDLALTLLAAGREVRYTGSHKGVFRFESVKLAAIRRSSEPSEVDPLVAEQDLADQDLRRFFSFH